MAHILIAEDDHKQAHLLQAYLQAEGHRVVVATDGAQALERIQERRPDLLLLDVMMPTVDGWQVLQQLEVLGEVPVIVLSTRAAEADQLLGFSLGADDYVTKPYSPRQVMARVRAVLRRTARAETEQVRLIGDLRIDLDRYEVRVAGAPVALTSREMTLLITLSEHPGRVFTRSHLLEEAAGMDSPALERTIDMHVFNLRRKIEPDPAHPRYLLTVKGRGYKLVAPENVGAAESASPTPTR
ncbi:DNA-binding response regulator [Arachnia propionica]|uniref:DNA-binding response regulator n=1 Tax=Arachnia propionica TaxID=1750 RepID=A0A3P1T334_9ACTN|nr:response regulator transcription factor [Arachnia propionica]MDO5083079.1 response regulator transcription factor [Arachnia propionica]RRD03555.1 DNA-binding response regulator [Arachnia propionica]